MKNTPFFKFAGLLRLRNSILILSIIAISALFMSQMTGCSSGPTSPGSAPGMQTTTIYGRVTDESGAAMTGVTVSGGLKTATTDKNGIFIIKDATVPEGRALVIAKKSGYFTAAHAEAPNANGTTRIELSMMSDASTATVAATTGGSINVTGGATIAFSGGSFTDASGAAYSGQVKVSARFLDPKNANFFDFFAGDDMAQTTDGKSTSLISSGVLRVELKDASGNLLKLDPTKPATLNFPKPLDTKAPVTMPLWYFDETLGMWKEEGTATLKNGMYTGTVTHFTDWNLDYKDSSGTEFSSADVTLRVVCNGVPISGVAVSIVGDDAPGKYFVHPGAKTGPDGRITFLRFPFNRPTLIDINSTKNAGLYYINTPISVNVTNGQKLDLGDISLNSPCPASVQGTLTGCDGTNTEGLVVLSDGTNLSYYYTKTGTFVMQAASGIPLTLDAMDVNGNQAATTNVPALGSGELRNIGSIKICGSATSTFIDITTPGTTKEGVMVAMSADGSKLAAWQNQPSQITVYDSKTGNTLSSAVITGLTYITGMYFSADNNKLLLSTTYGPTQIYDVSGATATLLLSINGAINARFFDDGTKVVAAVSETSPNPPALNVYSATDGSVIRTFHPVKFGSSADSTGTFGFIQDEQSVVYMDSTGTTARVFSLKTGVEIRNFPITGNHYTFASSEDGLAVVTSTDYITYSCFDTKAGTKIGDVKGSTSANTRYNRPALTKSLFFAADQATGAEVIRISKMTDGTSTLKLLSGSTYVSSVAASRNEQYLAAANSGTIRIWKLQ